MMSSSPEADLREQLAKIEHDRWADWQRYLHSRCIRHWDGALIIPPDLVTRWERQIATPYAELSEQEKQSDREQVDRYWPLIASARDPFAGIKSRNIDLPVDGEHVDTELAATEWRVASERDVIAAAGNAADDIRGLSVAKSAPARALVAAVDALAEAARATPVPSAECRTVGDNRKVTG